MKYVFLRALHSVLIGIAIMTMSSMSIAQADTLPQTIQKIKRSVVAIGTYEPTRAPRGEFRATGYAVSDGLHVITNYHVIKPILDIEHKEVLGIFIGEGESTQFRPVQVEATDPVHDVALLKFSGTPLPVLELGDSDSVQEGWVLYFTGYPIGSVLGLYPASIRAGISSITPIVRPAPNARYLNAKMLRREEDPFKVFQLDGISYPGNSGSPLYDPQTGRVYGTLNSTFIKSTKENVLKDPSAISYAIPSRYAKELLQHAGLNP
jgi:serine protease Do